MNQWEMIRGSTLPTDNSESCHLTRVCSKWKEIMKKTAGIRISPWIRRWKVWTKNWMIQIHWDCFGDTFRSQWIRHGSDMVWPPRRINVTYMQQLAVGHRERENLSLLLTAVALQEGGPLPGLETGLLSNTWKWIVQGDTRADKARDFIGKGRPGGEQ